MPKFLTNYDLVKNLLLDRANREVGLIADNIISETGLSRATVYRILREPGFGKSDFPRYPTGYYYNTDYKPPRPDNPRYSNPDLTREMILQNFDPIMMTIKQAVEGNKQFIDGAQNNCDAIWNLLEGAK